MMRCLILLVVSGVLTVSIASSSMAGGKKKGGFTTPAPVAAGPTISSVDANSIAVSDRNGTKTLAITQFTEISVNGRKTTAAALKPGMSVNVTLADRQTASRITATEK